MTDSADDIATSAALLKRKTFAGAFWVGGGEIAQVLVRIGVMMILARLLSPADFGVFALALVIVQLCQTVAPLGTSVALVQLRQVGVAEIRASLTISLLFATPLAAAAVVAGWLLEVPMNVPGLGRAVLLLTPAIYFDAIGKIASRMLQKSMNFRPSTVSSLIGYLFGYGLVASLLAVQGYGWVALCLGEAASVLVAGGYLVWVARPPLGANFDWQVWKRLLGFGSASTVSNLVSWATNSSPRLILGAVFGASSVGLYARAADLSSRLGALVDKVSNTVLFAALCTVNDDAPKLARTLTALISLVLVAILPVAAVLSGLAKPVVVALFGTQWLGAVETFRILAFLIPFYLVQRLSLVIGQSRGHPIFGVKAYFTSFVVSSAGAVVGARHGPEGVAVAVLIGVGAGSVYAFRMVAADVGLPFTRLLSAFARGAALAALLFAASIAGDDLLLSRGIDGSFIRVAVVGTVMALVLLTTLVLGRRLLLSPPASAILEQSMARVLRMIRKAVV